MFTKIIINKIWTYPLPLRKLIFYLFSNFTSSRYSKEELLLSINESAHIQKTLFADAIPNKNRLEVLENSAALANKNQGIVAEFGVFRGMSLRVLADSLPNMEVYGFDSFDGLPEDWGNILPRGHFKTDVPKLSNDNVHLVVGLFDETLEEFILEKKPKISLVHIDCDLYDATLFVLEKIKPCLIDGAIIIFDEYYGYPSSKDHEYKAWKVFLEKNNITSAPLFYSAHSASFKIFNH